MIKTNFKISKDEQNDNINSDSEAKPLTQSEFEDFIIRSGAAGSFMVFRSEKKEEELGLEEL